MSKSCKNITRIVFILLFFLYIGYNYIDFAAKTYETLRVGDILKYCSIVLCFLLAILNSKQASSEKDALIVVVALAFTLLSDTLILLFQKNTAGVICFCFVHLCYIYRYKPNWIVKAATVSILLFFLLIVMRIFMQNQFLSFENIFAVLYAFLFVLDFVSFSKADKGSIKIYFVWVGLILFLLCDINVAMFNILPKDGILYAMATNLMWVFYLPSQVLLALSSRRKNKMILGEL